MRIWKGARRRPVSSAVRIAFLETVGTRFWLCRARSQLDRLERIGLRQLRLSGVGWASMPSSPIAYLHCPPSPSSFSGAWPHCGRLRSASALCARPAGDEAIRWTTAEATAQLGQLHLGRIAMLGLMQDWPLLCHKILDHAARQHGSREIVSRRSKGRSCAPPIATSAPRALKVAQRLERDGFRRATASRTLAWNTARHLEAWYGIMGMGGVYHTLNPRLFPEQIAWIMNHAEDQALFVDLTFMPIVEKIAAGGEVAEEGDRADRRRAHAADGAARTPSPMRTGWPRPTATSAGKRSTRTPPPACATPPAPRAIPRAWSTAIAPTCCTP